MKKALEEAIRLLCHKFDIPEFYSNNEHSIKFWHVILVGRRTTPTYLLYGMRFFENDITHSGRVHLRL